MSRTGGMHVDVGSQLPKVWLSGRITRKLPRAVHIHLAALAVPQRQKVEVRSSTTLPWSCQVSTYLSPAWQVAYTLLYHRSLLLPATLDLDTRQNGNR